VVQLSPEELADAARDWPLAGAHVGKRPDGAVAADQPEDVETAQRVDRRNPLRRRSGRGGDEILGRQL